MQIPDDSSSLKEYKKWMDIFHIIGKKAQIITDKLSGTEKAGKILGIGAGGDQTVWIDKAVEDIIISELKKIDNVRLISEEAGIIDIGKPLVTIIADPVDGSNNAKLGIPMYALSLALVDMRDTIGNVKLGYVRNLVSGQEYTAIKSKGAFCNGNRLRPSNNSNIKMLGVELSQYSKGNLELNVKYLRMAEKIRALGSIALDLCYVASGALDALIDVRDCIRTLDIAAGFLILEESGGIITDLNGKDIYGSRIDPKTRLCFLAAGNTKIHNLLMETH